MNLKYLITQSHNARTVDAKLVRRCFLLFGVSIRRAHVAEAPFVYML